MRIADFGFKAKGKLAAKVEQQIAEFAQGISEVFDIDPLRVGSGIRITMGDENSIELDQVSNLVDMTVRPQITPGHFAYTWAGALHHFSFIENYSVACSYLTTSRVPRAEAQNRIATRWKHAEMAIHNTLESVFGNGLSTGLLTQQAYSDIIHQFHRDIDGYAGKNMDLLGGAIRTLMSAAEGVGLEFGSDNASALSMLAGIRSECAEEIQRINRLGDTHIVLPIIYASRMYDLADQTGIEGYALSVPAIAIASYICSEKGFSLQANDPRLLPTEEELVEIREHMPEFINFIKSTDQPLFESIEHSSEPAVGISARKPSF